MDAYAEARKALERLTKRASGPDWLASCAVFVGMHADTILQSLRGREWLPIESAPRDTLMLLRVEFSDVPVVGSHHSKYGWMVDTEHHDVSCSQFCYGGSVCTERDFKPTHWQPIPAAPTDTGGQAS